MSTETWRLGLLLAKEANRSRLSRSLDRLCLFQGVTLRGGSGAHEGNVFVKGKPVCHDSWDDTDAEVVCRSQKLLISASFI